MHLSARKSCFCKNVSVGHFQIFHMWSRVSKRTGSLPQIIFVNGKHILIDGNTQKETRTSNKKSTFFMSHTDALYQSEENAPWYHFNFKDFKDAVHMWCHQIKFILTKIQTIAITSYKF